MNDPTGTPVALQDVKHTWDAGGNLTQRENVKDTEKEAFTYDFLDRLTLLTAENYFQFTFGDTGSASSKVNTPYKAAVDSSGNILVADVNNYRVAKYNSSGVYQSSFGSQGSGDGQFVALGGIAVDSSGNIYTTEWWSTHRVQKFDSNGNYLTQWDGSGSGTAFSGPRDIVFDPSNGYLYVADRSNHRIVYFDSSGAYKGEWGGPSSGAGDNQFNGPWGVGVNTFGDVLVADTGNHRIMEFTSTGQFKWKTSGTSSSSGNGQFNNPRDVAVDSSGNVWVADTYNHRIQKLNSSGTFVAAFGSSGTAPGQFSGPYGVTLNSNSIWVVDTGNNRLQTYDLSTTAGWAYNQIGNMTLRDGVSYTYPTDHVRPHAATAAGSKTYAYDSNGSVSTWNGKTLTWDIENRLTAITGGVTYVYDGNGFRVKKTENSVVTVYVNQYYEKNVTTSTANLYYYLGGKMVAYKSGSTLSYVHQDQLTGTSLTTDSSGNSAGAIKYRPYGETRTSSGTLPSQKFTGQRLDDVGLYYYASRNPLGSTGVSPGSDPLTVSSLWGGRYYDPVLARFISPDTIVPDKTNPQTLNRYSYADNNPLKYVDDDGHFPFAIFAPVAVGALIGLTVSVIAYVGDLRENPQKTFSGGGLGQAIASGAVSGALTAAAITPGLNVMAGAAIAMGAGAVGYAAGEATRDAVNQLAGNPVESSASVAGMVQAAAGAGIGFAVGQVVSSLANAFTAPWGTKLGTAIESFNNDSIARDKWQVRLLSGLVAGGTELAVNRLDKDR